MKKLDEISVNHINRYLRQLEASGSFSTAKRKEISLRKFFDWANSQGFTANNPFKEKASFNNKSLSKTIFNFNNPKVLQYTVISLLLALLLTFSVLILKPIKANQEVLTGKSYIPKGAIGVVVKSNKISKGSIIQITPTSSTKNIPLYINSQSEGKFTVSIENAAFDNITFNWTAVNNK